MTDTTTVRRQLDEITDEVRAEFGGMTAEQLNWKPNADGWSIAQCLDHLILTNNLMLPAVEAKVRGAANTFWESWSPFTGIGGRFLSRTMLKDNKKFKAPSNEIVPPSEISPDIVDRFAENQSLVAEKIDKCAHLDWGRTVITSPFMRLMTYKLSDGITILVEHEKRHIRQAKRVRADPGFPAATAAAA